MFRFSGPVDNAAHHGNFHLFDAGVTLLPCWHLFAQVGLDLLGHFLEEGARSASAAGAGRYLRSEAADAQ